MSEKRHRRTATPTEANRRVSRLVLTGFMGAGKSTVGAFLAESLGWRFFDLDSCIEADCSRSVAEIFREHGEAYFRSKERELLERLSHERESVLSLGGGTIEDPIVLKTLLGWEDACMVFLNAPLEELLGRVNSVPATRPLFTTPEELAARHQRRLPSYLAAHLTIETTGLAPKDVAAKVLDGVRNQWRIEKRGTTAHGKPRRN